MPKDKKFKAIMEVEGNAISITSNGFEYKDYISLTDIYCKI